MAGATAGSYKVTSNDVGHRLRVTVTAKNTAGSSFATSAATVVAVAVSTVTVNGASIPITSVSLPNRLVVDRSTFTPSTIGSRSDQIVARIRVVDSNGNPVGDALVYAIGVPANRVTVPPETRTDQNGWATVVFQPLAGLPLKQGSLLTIFIRARKPGENLLAGVSTRRLVSIRVNPT